MRFTKVRALMGVYFQENSKQMMTTLLKGGSNSCYRRSIFKTFRLDSLYNYLVEEILYQYLPSHIHTMIKVKIKKVILRCKIWQAFNNFVTKISLVGASANDSITSAKTNKTFTTWMNALVSAYQKISINSLSLFDLFGF